MAVGDAIAVTVGVAVGKAAVAVGVAVGDELAVAVGVAVGERVAVTVGVAVRVSVGLDVVVGVRVGAGTTVVAVGDATVGDGLPGARPPNTRGSETSYPWAARIEPEIQNRATTIRSQAERFMYSS